MTPNPVLSGRLADTSEDELPPVTVGTFYAETSSMRCLEPSTFEAAELADEWVGAAVPEADDVSGKTGTISRSSWWPCERS